MVREIAAQLDIGPHAVQEMIANLGYRKVCSRWIPRLFQREHKNTHMGMSSQLLQRQAAESDDLLFCIMTGNESWFYHFDQATKTKNGVTPHL